MTWAELEAIIAKATREELKGLPIPSAKRVAKRAVEDLRVEAISRGVTQPMDADDEVFLGWEKK